MALPAWSMNWAYPVVPPTASATPGVDRTVGMSESGISARLA